MASNFDQEIFEIILKNNKVNEEKFDAFHEEFFNGMIDQSLFLACKLLHDKGERPGAGEFEKKLNDLTKEIMEEKIKLLEKILKRNDFFGGGFKYFWCRVLFEEYLRIVY